MSTAALPMYLRATMGTAAFPVCSAAKTALAALCLLLLAPLAPALSSSPAPPTPDPGSAGCLEGCVCRPDFYSNEKYTLRLECRGIPDWEGLARLAGPVSVSLGVRSLPGLRREDFPSASAIVSLDLVGDTRLEPDVFQNLRESLEDLTLIRLDLAFNSSFTFLEGLPRLRRLSLIDFDERSDGVRLSGSPFRGLGVDNLKLLSINDENIASLGADVFQDLGAEEVEFTRTGLREFPGEALRKVRHLVSVSLHDNPLRRLGNGATEGLGLTRLTLTQTQLEAVEGGSLAGVQDSLQTLDLSGNLLTDVPYDAIAPLRALQTLELMENPVREMARPITGEVCLQSFRLSSPGGSARLRRVHPQAFASQGRCLQRLRLEDTALTELPSLAGLESLSLVAVSSQAMTSLQARALAGSGVRLLVISAPLDTVEPGAFEGMTSYPVSVTLLDTRLETLDFFFQYGRGTFLELEVVSSRLPCDCRLAGVNLNLGLPMSGPGGQARPGRLGVACLLGGEMLTIDQPLVQDVFSNCTDIPVLAPRVLNAGSRPGDLPGLLWLLSLCLLSPLSLGFTPWAQ